MKNKIISAVVFSVVILNCALGASAYGSEINVETVWPDSVYVPVIEEEPIPEVNDENADVFEEIPEKVPQDYVITDDYIEPELEITEAPDYDVSSDGSELLYSESSTLSDGLEYTRNLYYHPQNGNQREYILEYAPNDSTRLVFGGNEYLYSAAVIKNIAGYECPEDNFIAGINADFFNMSTGVPASAFIRDYELYTTDRDNFCLVVTDDGKYFIDKPSVKLSLTDANGGVLEVSNLNKEFSVYALYMYNSRYSSKTHISDSYSEAVLLPYDVVMSKTELVDFISEKNLLHELDDENSENYIKSLEKFSGFKHINGRFYHITGIFPSIGYSEKVVVSRVSSNCKNTEIPKYAYLLCGATSSCAWIVDNLKAGDTFEFFVSGNSAFENVINAIGVGTVIVKNSEVVEDTSISHYSSLQPRSAVGIKADGSLVFYAVDGRQKNTSAGLKLTDLSEKMISLGCIYAANLDGGGSTAVLASRPGIDNAQTVNRPSGGSERRIANAFLFVNDKEKGETPKSVHYYDDSIITFHDWLIKLPEPVISDENGYSYENKENISINYFTYDGKSYISDGILYPNGVMGRLDVFASLNGTTPDTPAFSVFTVDAPDKIILKADKTELAPYETAVLDISALYKNLNVISGFQSFVWSVKASCEEYASSNFGKVENGIFYPFAKGEEYTITASRGGASESITVKVDAYPFSDIEGHWAVKEIYKLAKEGVVNGYPDDQTGAFVYLPQRNYSRYEFCAMLERITGIGGELEIPDNPYTRPNFLGFADAVSVPDWAYPSVYKLSTYGLLNGIMQTNEYGNSVFNGADYITRADVMTVIGMLCETAPSDYSTDMYFDLDETQMKNQYIKNCLYAGIFSGYEDMSLKPMGLLTRAEAAAVFVRLDKYLSEN